MATYKVTELKTVKSEKEESEKQTFFVLASEKDSGAKMTLAGSEPFDFFVGQELALKADVSQKKLGGEGK